MSHSRSLCACESYSTIIGTNTPFSSSLKAHTILFSEKRRRTFYHFFLKISFLLSGTKKKKREAVSLKPPPSCSAVVNFSVQTIESRRFDAGRDSSGGSARQKTKTLPGTHWLKSGSEGALGQLTTKSFCADKIRSLEFVASLAFRCHAWNTWRAEIPRDEFHCWLLEVTLAEFKMEHAIWTWYLKMFKTPLYLCSLSLMANYSLSLDTRPLLGVSFGVLGLFMFWLVF